MIAFFECESAALLRTPKVYNALITTDQNLTPSRAYPVIQPTIHDSPFIYGPYGYTPYSYYDPFGYNPFESAAFVPKYGADDAVNGPAIGAASTVSASGAAAATDAAAASRSANGASKDDRSVVHGGSTQKPPIPLNEFGFPPSLIPLSAGNGKNPINLAPFSYNSYPLIYDQFAGYPHSPAYLPHFGVIPQTAYGGFGGTTQPNIGNENITPSSAIPGANDNDNSNANGPGAAEDAAAADAQNNQNNNANPDDAANGNGSFDDESSIDRQRGNNPQQSGYFDRENGVGQSGNDGVDEANNGGFRTAASNGIGSTDRQRGSNAASGSTTSSGGGRSNGASNGKQTNKQDSFRRSSSSTSGSTFSSSSSSSAASNGAQQSRGKQNGHLKA